MNIFKELDSILAEYHKSVIEIGYCDECHDECNAEDMFLLENDCKLCENCFNKKNVA